MNLVLIGYRATGKSTIADLLHQRLAMPVFHMDSLLEERFGERIADFVARHGWDAFRDTEAALVQELVQHSQTIIDTGGGVVTRQANVHALRKNGFLVWLRSDPEKIAERISWNTDRPSLTGAKSAVEEVKDVLRVREPLYEAAADFQLVTDNHPLPRCAEIILEAWRKRNEALETP
ncbi:MAG: shikimate kinase [bacterium]